MLISCYGLNTYAWVKSLFYIRDLKVLLFHLLWVTSSGITYNIYKTWVDVFSFLSNSPILCHMPTICSASVTISWLLFPAHSRSAFLPLLVTQYSLQPATHLYFAFFSSCKWSYILLHWTRLEWEKKKNRLRHLVNFWQHHISSMGCLHSNLNYMWPTHFPSSCSRHSHYNRMKNKF